MQAKRHSHVKIFSRRLPRARTDERSPPQICVFNMFAVVAFVATALALDVSIFTEDYYFPGERAAHVARSVVGAPQ
jgi:hypothetical protein